MTELLDDLAGWTRRFEKYELAGLLQQQGIAAYPAVTAADLLERDPQLRSRAHYVVAEHPEAGRITQDGPAVKLSNTPGEVAGPAPCLGQHTAEVLQDVLGLHADEIERLARVGATV